MKRTTVALIAGELLLIACSGERNGPSIFVTPEPKSQPPPAGATITPDFARTLTPLPTRIDMTPVAVSTQAPPTPERSQITPAATPERGLKITGTTDAKTISELNRSVIIDAKITVLAPNIAVVAPTKSEIYGNSYVMVKGADGKWFQINLIDSMADQGGKFIVEQTLRGEDAKGGLGVVDVTTKVPFATKARADLARGIEDGRASNNKSGLTDGIATLPDGSQVIIYSLGNRVMGVRQMAVNGEVSLPGDKGFPLALAGISVQVAYTGDMTNLDVFNPKPMFVVANNDGVSLSEQAPAPEVKAVLGIAPDGTNLDEKLNAMQNKPWTGMVTLLPNSSGNPLNGQAFSGSVAEIGATRSTYFSSTTGAPLGEQFSVKTTQGVDLLGKIALPSREKYPIFLIRIWGNAGDAAAIPTGKEVDGDQLLKLSGKDLLLIGVTENDLKSTTARFGVKGLGIFQ